MGRWLAVDYGARRIGTALSDRAGTIAFPHRTLDGQDRPREDARVVLREAEAEEADAIVVGLPINMDGSEGPQARRTRKFAEALAEIAHRPIELWDERLTSFQADEWLDQADVAPGRRRGLRDALAAKALLQSFLDARRAPDAPANPEPPADPDAT